jgi:hypothetical protein
MSQDEKKIAFKVGRPVQHENVQYGVGTYQLTPAVADALKRKNAGAPVDEHIAAAKSRGVAGDAGSTAEFGDKPDQTVTRTDPNRDNPLSRPLAQPQGEGTGAGTGEGSGEGGPKGINPGGGAPSSASDVSSKSVEQLSGELPNDFPQFEKLVGAGVLRYEQLTTLTSAQLTAIGIDEAGVQEISTRLYEDAQKSAQP